MESLWVLILLIVAFCTIVTVRAFVNGVREDTGAALDSLAPVEAPATAPASARRGRAASRVGASPPAASAAVTPPAPVPRAAARRRATRAPASQVAAWPGGDCPNCGSPTVPSAKFCGECGHRLVP